MTAGLRLGAPGVYRWPRPVEPTLQAVRLDVAGFVGVTLRGPVDTPTPVSSWSDYQRRFGGFEGPVGPADDPDPGGPDRMLPYAIQAFFAQGGTSAYVVRVVAPDPAPASTQLDPVTATAWWRLGLGAGGGSPVVEIAAADEGSWANRVTVRLDYELARSFRADVDGGTELVLLPGATMVPGSLLRIRRADLPPAGQLHWAGGVVNQTTAVGTRRRVAPLDPPLPVVDHPEVDVAVVTAALVVEDHDPGFARQERLAGLGLRREHPRFLGDVSENGVLQLESLLVRAAGSWPEVLAVDPVLRPVAAERIRDGTDRWQTIDRSSFFDDGDAGDDPLDEQEHHRGVDGMGRVPQIGLLCVPDLQWCWQGGPVPEDPPPARPGTGRFEPGPCAAPQPDPAAISYVTPGAPPARLDPRDPGQLSEIVDRQLRLVQVAELRQRFVTLLDVPAGLPVGGITAWRTQFNTSYAAAYHPWLGVPRAGTAGATLVQVPPSAFATGIIAAREQRLGLPWGPANELAAGAVAAADSLTDAVHDELHLLGVNVYRAERDGLRLSAARTLSSDPDYRQLSVRRLMTMLALTLERQCQWLVFEPNTDELRGLLRHTLTQFLCEQYRSGTFAGDTEEQSFFVRCDDSTNPPSSQALGRLVAEVGVAPAAPLEYLVLRISQDTDGTVSVVTDHG